MWLFDKIKNGYNTVVNKVLNIAIRRDSTRLARFAVTLGADPFPSRNDENGFIEYPLLELCKSRRMIELLASRGKYSDKDVMLFAVRNDLFVVAEFFISRGVLPDTIVPVTHNSHAEKVILMNACKSQAMLDLLINKTLEKDKKYRTISLVRCIWRLSENNFSETEYRIQLILANKLLDKGIEINAVEVHNKETLIHVVAKYTAPLTEAVLTLFDRIVALKPELLHCKSAENITPLDLMKRGPNSESWWYFLSTAGYLKATQPKPPITDRYSSTRSMSNDEHVVTESNEAKTSFPTASHTI